MKKTKFLILVVLLVGTQISYAQKNAHVYSSEKGKCSISFISEYEETEKELNNGSILTSAQLIVGNDIYLFSFIEFDVEVSKENVSSTLNVTFNSFVKSIKGNVLSEKKYKYKGTEGKEAVMTLSNNYYTYYRAIIINNIQYQFVYMSLDENKKKAKVFFKSFKIK